MNVERDSAREEYSPAITVELLADSVPNDELEDFLDAEWDAWRQAEGHDSTIDWSGSPLSIIARNPAGEIVGAANGRVAAGIGYLGELMIAAQRRGEGVGTVLLRRFEDFCWSSGCHKLTVITAIDEPAHYFYASRDWQEEAIFRRDRGGRDFVRLCKFIEDQQSSRKERR